jgi:hypothetical protein
VLVFIARGLSEKNGGRARRERTRIFPAGPSAK